MRDRIAHWIARHVPRRVTYWCAIVTVAHATQGKYSSTVVPELTAMDAIKRAGDDWNL